MGVDPAPQSIAESISLLGRNDLLDADHIEHLLGVGAQAIPHLLPLLDLPLSNERNDLTDESPHCQNNVTIVAEVARLLGKLKAGEAIPKLEALANTNWVEVHRNATASLAALKASTSDGLALNRNDPYRQIGELWTAIIQGRNMLHPPEVLEAWATEAVAALPDLMMANMDKARAWAMTGSLLYKAKYPEWNGSPYYLKGKSPEARRCFQEALKISREGLWMEFEQAL